MPLNIKDEEVHARARELARLTGTSLTAAVREAIDDRLARMRHREGHHRASAERLLEIARACSGPLAARGLTSDHTDLYDEDGMPR